MAEDPRTKTGERRRQPSNPEFEQLHPRGADGTFIEKSGQVNVDGKERAEVVSIGPNGIVVRYPSGTTETISLQQAATRLNNAPKARARLTALRNGGSVNRPDAREGVHTKKTPQQIIDDARAAVKERDAKKGGSGGSGGSGKGKGGSNTDKARAATAKKKADREAEAAKKKAEREARAAEREARTEERRAESARQTAARAAKQAREAKDAEAERQADEREREHREKHDANVRRRDRAERIHQAKEDVKQSNYDKALETANNELGRATEVVRDLQTRPGKTAEQLRQLRQAQGVLDKAQSTAAFAQHNSTGYAKAIKRRRERHKENEQRIADQERERRERVSDQKQRRAAVRRAREFAAQQREYAKRRQVADARAKAAAKRAREAREKAASSRSSTASK